jgi:hypothetical protein
MVGTMDMKYWNLWKGTAAVSTVPSSGFSSEGR